MADTIRPYSEIGYLVADRIATITLSRPDQLNAFTQVMRDELIDAFDRADSDDDVRVVVVTGRGRAFCAGADLSAGSDTFNADRRQRSGTARTIDGGKTPVESMYMWTAKPNCLMLLAHWRRLADSRAAWTGAYDYFGWKAIKRTQPVFGRKTA